LEDFPATIVIGSSTGGPQALKKVIPLLPRNFPARILIVQHMPPKFTETFAQRLNSISEIDVFEAKDGDIPQPGKAFLAPGDHHMYLDSQGIIRLNQDPPVSGLRPCIDVTIKSVSNVFPKNLICVILTGMGHDGRDGVRFARERGAYCIAENESTCVVYGMPKSVVEAGQSDVIAPIHEISNEIIKAIMKN
jgi:two-component system, chemotaxis family, protein-glutamate methylesterase/glutaminase